MSRQSWLDGLIPKRDRLEYELYEQCCLLIEAHRIHKNRKNIGKRYNKMNHMLQSADPIITWEELISDFPDLIDKVESLGWGIIRICDHKISQYDLLYRVNHIRAFFNSVNETITKE